MTAAQQLRQEGMQQGMLQEKYFIAKNLLREQVDLELVARSTDLTLTELKKLKEQLVA